jgi:hypothetical protein
MSCEKMAEAEALRRNSKFIGEIPSPLGYCIVERADDGLVVLCGESYENNDGWTTWDSVGFWKFS